MLWLQAVGPVLHYSWEDILAHRCHRVIQANSNVHFSKQHVYQRIFCIPAVLASPHPCDASPLGTVAGRPRPGSWSHPRPIPSPCSLSPWKQTCSQHMARKRLHFSKRKIIYTRRLCDLLKILGNLHVTWMWVVSLKILTNLFKKIQEHTLPF